MGPLLGTRGLHLRDGLYHRLSQLLFLEARIHLAIAYLNSVTIIRLAREIVTFLFCLFSPFFLFYLSSLSSPFFLFCLFLEIFLVLFITSTLVAGVTKVITRLPQQDFILP